MLCRHIVLLSKEFLVLLVKFCKSCLYPENAKPTIYIDEEGICSGCRFHQNKSSKESPIDWDQREKLLDEIIIDMKARAKKSGSPHDCLIPVSGGKDSHFQVFELKKRGVNPLLLSFNHTYNAPAGIANLRNLVEKSGFDHIRYSIGRSTAAKLSRMMLENNGDITWHYHAGIYSLPSMVAYRMNIPYVVWGDQGFAELTGVLNPEDIIEFQIGVVLSIVCAVYIKKIYMTWVSLIPIYGCLTVDTSANC